MFEQVTDPRNCRGRRHRLPVLFVLATCVVLAGARPFTAVGESRSPSPPRPSTTAGVTSSAGTGLAGLGATRSPRFGPPSTRTPSGSAPRTAGRCATTTTNRP
ncbi:transposase family protein [Pseudofrankia sp. BMG5.37]|uniref:transposase family protein n=1 Tax=Pseudofrankia sp. BMG5.37 TaxID=3050035 RepID=UPI0023791194|nr:MULTISPECIES: transposase family protein [unclassified Pseudofrankia]MDT3446749.1 transposase family protein [Pseudofrankia sp. BMG5.37]